MLAGYRLVLPRAGGRNGPSGAGSAVTILRDGEQSSDGDNGVDGFHVDLAALDEAGRSINRALEFVAGHRVDAAAEAAAAVGHEQLATSLTAFCQQWQRGIGSLAGDAQGLAHELSQCVTHYRDVDHQVCDQLSRLDRSGPAQP